MENIGQATWFGWNSTQNKQDRQAFDSGIDINSGYLKSKDQTVKGAMIEGKRQTFGDITNRSLQSNRTLDSKGLVKAPSFVTKLQQSHSLQHSAFCDPSLIDGSKIEKGRRDWIDIDKQNEDDPQACSAYAHSIFQYLREAELNKRANSKYLEDMQVDVNAKMRAILVDWLVEVSEEYKLCADTLYQAVNYIDRFLSLQSAQRSQLQLIGVTCMWLAAKYEEIYPPNVADFCYITDNTYSREQMIQMEEVVLKRLSYELTVPTAKTFLRRLLQVCNPDEHLHFLSNYLTELSLLDYSMLEFTPSVIAAAGIFLANLMLSRTPWDGNLRHYSSYVPADIKLCVTALSSVHLAVGNSTQLAAIREKYAHARFHEVSRLPSITIMPYMFSNQH
ncbi:hypothetical protein CEUSTIGMA_g8951.t1 [Chlamydomonas eustigma]|uniref:Uncharacterized protein n=1 Tax=Chlamydomonas eustigma TaxID=1157962 RepID=A0A250XEN2_9CHLO|nr:hypothetical protein CEUSTIGMA_g8951.t1 [Chlamydomonas eustigma]|eukprot:GAX81523.1 hypothetical protein CEUSTIGMA_g8951.t1 [Chlamydomonas eustigma]